VITQRSVFAAVWYAFFSGSAMMVVVYYVPIWFQAILGVSAVGSGIRTLALVLSLVFGSVLGGGVTFRTGYYTPSMIVGSLILSVGAGLLTTWSVTTKQAQWIGYQVIFGFGLGLGMQQGTMAIQTVLPREDVSTGTALVFFGQSLGGMVAISVAQNVFVSKLGDYLGGIEGLDVVTIVHAGTTGLRRFVPPELLSQVLDAFSRALVNTFFVALAASCIGIFGALGMEWRSIKKGEGQGAKKTNSEIEDIKA
jgi:MFS family permease